MLAKVYVQMACLTDEYFTEDEGINDPQYTDDERQSFWDLAYKNAKEVYESHKYSLVPLFADLWNQNSRNTDESIFELQYGNSGSVLQWCTNRTLSGPTSPNPPATANWYNYAPQTVGQINNWGRLVVSKATFAEHWIKYGTGEHLKQIVSNRTADIDPRINVTYLYLNDAYPEIGKSPSGGNSAIWPSTTFTMNHNGAWCFIKKYWYDDYTKSNTNCPNVIIYRYADLLLLLAEAANEHTGNNQGEATGYVNEVLERARRYRANGMTVSGTQPEDWPSTLSQDELRWAIMDERKYELLGEEQELFDARRRGTEYMRRLVELNDKWVRISRMGTGDKSIYSEGGWGRTPGAISTSNWVAGSELFYFNDVNGAEIKGTDEQNKFLRQLLFFPFPLTERNINTAIPLNDQNYGWGK